MGTADVHVILYLLAFLIGAALIVATAATLVTYALEGVAYVLRLGGRAAWRTVLRAVGR